MLLLDANPFPGWVYGRWIWHGTVSPQSRREKGFRSVIFPFPPREKYSHAEVGTNWSLLQSSSRSEHQAGSPGSSLAFQIVSDNRHGLMESSLIRQPRIEDEGISPSRSMSELKYYCFLLGVIKNIWHCHISSGCSRWWVSTGCNTFGSSPSSVGKGGHISIFFFRGKRRRRGRV